MSEEQNNDNVTLADIQDEIKSMREEAKTQHKQTAIMSGLGVGGAICFLGISILVTVQASPHWRWFHAYFFIALGFGLVVYCWLTWRKLKKQKAHTGKNAKANILNTRQQDS